MCVYTNIHVHIHIRTMQHYRFIKVKIPDNEKERGKLAMSLMKYKVSLTQYLEVLEQPEIRM